MKSIRQTFSHASFHGVTLASSLVLALVMLNGCGSVSQQQATQTGLALHGMVHGGQQPISGAIVQMYAASLAGDGTPATPLLSQRVLTGVDGSFTIGGLYKCPSPGTLVYLVATQGDPGLGANNPQAAVMSVFGACGDLSESTFVTLNEETTVAAAWALTPYMTSFAAIGSGSADEAQFALAFSAANHLVNPSAGLPPGPDLPSGYTPPIAEINTLADILSTCINSGGGVVGDHSACGNLFAAVRPPSGPAATETIGAALQIAQHTGSDVQNIFLLAPSRGPFQPTLSSVPPDWTVTISPALFEAYVDAQSNRVPIDPNIYGIASYGLDTTFAAEIAVPNVRWGGDGTTRYNWQVDSSNAGFDWYFMGGDGSSTPVASGSADQMIATYKRAGAGSLITIPIIPYVNKGAPWNCSFPVSVYGPQQAVNPYVHPNGDICGNSIAAANNPNGPPGTQLTDTNIYANHVDNSPTLQQGWVQHLVATFGSAAQGGVPFYQLDNEPAGWGNTHRDVEPKGQPYSTIVNLGQQYAAVVKTADPTAAVMGPSDFTLGGWIGTPSAQNGLFAGQFYLQQMAAYDKLHGGRILDYFDEHYYPQFNDATSQLASTRTLWDPTYNGGTWVEQYYFYGPMDLIPRFKQWIRQYDPGTKLAFSEYSIDSGQKKITDALAEADMLGIFGAFQVDFANMWNTPAPTDPIAFAFRLYRNYDGAGGRFGETSLQAVSTDPSQLAIYAAQRTADGALVLIVLNKTPNAIETALSLANFVPSGPAAVYTYSAADLSRILSEGNLPVEQGNLSYNFLAYSATVIVLSR
jgi:hypothetical protein